VTATPLPTPLAIERALRGLRGVTACIVEDGPKFHAGNKRWVITLSLQREVGAPFVGKSTRWCVLLDEIYPFGRVLFYPASDGGLKATFPHQDRNTPDRHGQGWRGGKLCLDTPFAGERRVTVVRDPVGDAETRLRWHVERAIEWLRRAASNRLLAPGDPFEIPARPHTATAEWARYRIIHDESVTSFSAWSDREGASGVARLGAITDIANAIAVARFEDWQKDAVRVWAGRELREPGDDQLREGFWWLWPKPIVLAPWQAPDTWGELRRIAKAVGFDVDVVLRRLAPEIRGAKMNRVLLLGYPMPLRIDAPASEIHWDALVLPRLAVAAGTPPNGFRSNAVGWWQRDRRNFADHIRLEYLHTENWSSGRLQARGRLPGPVRTLKVALLGVGALGSMLAEMLVRAGLGDIALFDDDLVTAGNVCRHVTTLVDVGRSKVQAVAQRLRQISPAVRVTEMGADLRGDAKMITARFEPYDAVIDCSASDEVGAMLATAWWPIPRLFASFSMGYQGQRLFSFGVRGHQYPEEAFSAGVRPWLDLEATAWVNDDEVLEGAGCWSPLFPVRHEDVALAAAICVKELEHFCKEKPRAPLLRVFAKEESAEGFHAFVRESRPSSPQTIAS